MKLTKKLQKEIAKGNHGALMDGIEQLIDMYHYRPFVQGYECALDDMVVHSLRLAEHIKHSASLIGHKPRKDEDVYVVEVEDLAGVIEEYFNTTLSAK